jgi:predicted PurR-regulated permease PerM
VTEPTADAVRPTEPASTDRGSIVPGWVRGASNLFAMLVTAVAVGLALFLIAWLAPVLAPLGLGLFLAAIAAPLFTWLERRGRSSGLALALTIGALVVVGGAIVWLTITSAHTLAESMIGYADALNARYDDVVPATDPTGAATTLRDVIPPEVLVGALQAAVDIALQVGSSLVFAIVIAALLLLDGPRLAHLVAGGMGSENPVFREAPALARAAVTYIVVRIRINLITALGMLVLMLVVGVDHAPLWAVGVFFLSFVPYLGLILAMVPPTILAFAESGPVAALAIVAGGTVLNLIAENVLEPTLTGRALRLTTWLVFGMFFFWAWLIGPVGMLLAMPITVLMVLVLQHNDRTRWVATLLLRDAPDPGPALESQSAGGQPAEGASR